MASNARVYREPPIVEAVCEFRFEPSETWDATIPGLVYRELETTFPRKQQINRIQAKSSSGEFIELEISPMQQVQFQREDGTARVDISPNVLAIHHFRPYPTWQGFSPLIREAFDAYMRVTSPSGIQRIGLRYTNHIDIPGETIRLEDFFEFYPFLGNRLPQTLGGFIIGVEFHYHESRDILRLQLGKRAGSTLDVQRLSLDLDYFLAQAGEITPASVFDWLNEAYEQVEKTFEGCLTDRLRTQFAEMTTE